MMSERQLAGIRDWAGRTARPGGRLVRDLLAEVERLRAGEAEQLRQLVPLLLPEARQRWADTRAAGPVQLTGCERQALADLALGERAAESAHRRGIAVATVRKHRTWAIRRLAARTGTHAVALAAVAQMITADDVPVHGSTPVAGELTELERLVLVGLARGEWADETARRIGPSTTRNTGQSARQGLYRRLRAHTGAQAVFLAAVAGLVTAEHLAGSGER